MAASAQPPPTVLGILTRGTLLPFPALYLAHDGEEALVGGHTALVAPQEEGNDSAESLATRRISSC